MFTPREIIGVGCLALFSFSMYAAGQATGPAAVFFFVSALVCGVFVRRDKL